MELRSAYLIIAFLLIPSLVFGAAIQGKEEGSVIGFCKSIDFVGDSQTLTNTGLDCTLTSTAGEAGHSAVTISAALDTILSLSTQELGLDTQTANTVLAGPASGAGAVPTFRALVDDDIPNDITITESDPTIKNQVCFVIDGGGSAVTTGAKAPVRAVNTFTVGGAVILGDQEGSCVVDIWKDTTANYPPTDADSITASAPPTLSTATIATDTTLTGWTTTITAGDILIPNVDSCSTIERVEVCIYE